MQLKDYQNDLFASQSEYVQVHQDRHLQGWQRNRVYPDFLACPHDRGGGKRRFTVLEAKGLDLLDTFARSHGASGRFHHPPSKLNSNGP